MVEPDSALREGRHGLRAGPWALCLLLLVYVLLAAGSARQKSVTVDELGHLPSGLYFLQTGDARYASLNPPLVNALSAVPVLFLDLEQAPAAPPPSEDVLSFWSSGYHFQEMHRADYVRIFQAARWVPILVVAGLGVALFCWGRRLAPRAPDLAGVLAAGFVCLSPNVIAQARLVGTDTGTAFLVTLALWSLRGMLRKPGVGSSLLCGAVLGLAQLSKFTALLLYPSFLGITLAWHAFSPAPRPAARRLVAGLAGALLVSLLVLNGGYLWREFGVSLSELSLHSATLEAWQGSVVGGLPLPDLGKFARPQLQWLQFAPLTIGALLSLRDLEDQLTVFTAALDIDQIKNLAFAKRRRWRRVAVGQVILQRFQPRFPLP